MVELEEKIESNKKNLTVSQNELPSLNSERANIENIILELNKSIKTNDLEVDNINQEILSNEEIIDQKRTESLTYDSSIQKIQIEIEQLVESVAEKNINIEIISKDEEEEMLKLRKEGNLSKAKFYRLQKSINEFGPVNLLAPEEYLKLEEKYDFIDKQLTDLDTSLMNLEKTIKKIDEESRTAFIDAFERISEKYLSLIHI